MLNRKKKIVSMVMVAGAILAVLLAFGCTGEKSNPVLDEAVALAKQADQHMVGLDWNAYTALVNQGDLDRFKTMVLAELERLASARNSDSVIVFDQPFSLVELRQEPSEKFFGDIMSIVFRVSPELNRSFSGMKNDFIGGVAESDSVIHVVAHTQMLLGTRHVDEMNVVTLRKVDDVWKLALSSKLLGVGYMIVESLQMQR